MTRHDLSVKSLRSSLASRRNARLQRRSLERQLASYTNESDQLEANAIMSRPSADEISELLSIINRQAMDRREVHALPVPVGAARAWFPGPDRGDRFRRLAHYYPHIVSLFVVC